MTIDTRGKACPMPLILTQKAIKEASVGDTIELLTDNETATCNIMDYLGERNITPQKLAFESGCQLIFEKPAQLPQITQNEQPITCSSSYIVVLSKSTMGSGDDELGTLLMRAFLNTLKENERLPSHIVLYNGGVKLTTQTDTATALISLQSQGVKIIACGTCIDFFDLKSEMLVGKISNMQQIVQILSSTPQIVAP